MITTASLFDELENIVKEAGLREGLKTLLTGRVPLFHGTSVERGAQILEKGLIPQGSAGVTQLLPGLAEAEKNLAFTSLNPSKARMYAIQQIGLSRLDKLRNLYQRLPESVKGMIPQSIRSAGNETLKDLPANNLISRYSALGLGLLPGGKKVVEADVPREFLKGKAALGKELPRMQEQMGPDTDKLLEETFHMPDLASKGLAHNFMSDVPVTGGIPSEYIRGSDKYKGITADELRQHVRNTISDPIGVGKDVLRSTLGIAHRPGTLISPNAKAW